MKKIKLNLVEIIYGYQCNLKCNGCSSASNLILDKSYDPTLESIYKSIDDLGKHVIPENIDLMGGELFLYWNKIEKIIIKIRENFPDVCIGLVTNGLLLDKFSNKLLNLCEKFHPCKVDITDHFTLFSEDVISKKYHNKLNEFFKNYNIPKTNTIKWNPSKQWLEKSKSLLANNSIKTLTIRQEIYETSTTKFQITKQQEFSTCYYENNQGLIKPYATHDPTGSYANGCSSPWCHTLINSKLYKCNWFVVLPYILELKNQLNDTDWGKYLNYKPLDLTNPAQEDLDYFYKTRLSSISQCDMCSNDSTKKIIQSKENVIS